MENYLFLLYFTYLAVRQYQLIKLDYLTIFPSKKDEKWSNFSPLFNILPDLRVKNAENPRVVIDPNNQESLIVKNVI